MLTEQRLGLSMELLRQYALTFIGKPYKWGGDDPIDGVDCSGLVQILLASVGLDPIGDQNAQALYDYFEKKGEWNTYKMGALAFYGKSVTQVTHVAMLLDQYRIIEAGGGGSAVTSKELAAEKNAYVRISLINYRSDLCAVIRPRFTTIGMP